MEQSKQYSSDHDKQNFDTWAWGGTAWWSSKAHFTEIQNTPGIEAHIIDLCSSVPIFAAMLRSRVNNHRYTQARNIAQNNTYLQVHQKVQDGMTAVLYELLSTPGDIPPVEEVIESMKDSQRQHYLYKRVPDGDSLLEKGRWRHLQQTPTNTSPLTVLTNALAPNCRGVNVDDEITRLVDQLVQPLALIKNTITITSLDIADPKNLQREAGAHLPDYYRNSKFFKDVLTFHGHVQGDLIHLPFQDQSTNLVTCFEGWPFYFSPEDMTTNVLVASEIARIIRNGGTGIIAPFSFQDSQGSPTLDQILQCFEEQGLTYEERNVEIQSLSEREARIEQLVRRDQIPVLYLQRPLQ